MPDGQGTELERCAGPRAGGGTATEAGRLTFLAVGGWLPVHVWVKERGLREAGAAGTGLACLAPTR